MTDTVDSRRRWVVGGPGSERGGGRSKVTPRHGEIVDRYRTSEHVLMTAYLHVETKALHENIVVSPVLFVGAMGDV